MPYDENCSWKRFSFSEILLFFNNSLVNSSICLLNKVSFIKIKLLSDVININNINPNILYRKLFIIILPSFIISKKEVLYTSVF